MFCLLLLSIVASFTEIFCRRCKTLLYSHFALTLHSYTTRFLVKAYCDISNAASKGISLKSRSSLCLALDNWKHIGNIVQSFIITSVCQNATG
jgi:hypothetical protein